MNRLLLVIITKLEYLILNHRRPPHIRLPASAPAPRIRQRLVCIGGDDGGGRFAVNLLLSHRERDDRRSIGKNALASRGLPAPRQPGIDVVVFSAVSIVGFIDARSAEGSAHFGAAFS
jgi:hypothetical protein